MNLPGHAIPYHFSAAETQAFLDETFAGATPAAAAARSVVLYGQPAWGTVIQGPYGEILVFRGADGTVHVVDVTNLAIARKINEAAYVSPDSGVVSNIMAEIESLLAGLTGPGVTIPMAVGIAAFLYLAGRR